MRSFWHSAKRPISVSLRRQAREHHARALHIATELGDHGRVGWTHAAMAEVCLANRELESMEAHVSSVMDAAKATVMAAAAQGQQADNKLALEAMLLGARRRTALVRACVWLCVCVRRTASWSGYVWCIRGSRGADTARVCQRTVAQQLPAASDFSAASATATLVSAARITLSQLEAAGSYRRASCGRRRRR
jgi:hypothetical protein